MPTSEEVYFSARQLKFIEWLAMPECNRQPPTQTLLADELGLNRRTLTRWKKNRDLQQAVLQRVRELLGDSLPEIYGALRREAIQGSFQHIRLILEMTGEYVPTERMKIEDVTIRVVWDDQMDIERVPLGDVP